MEQNRDAHPKAQVPRSLQEAIYCSCCCSEPLLPFAPHLWGPYPTTVAATSPCSCQKNLMGPGTVKIWPLYTGRSCHCQASLTHSPPVSGSPDESPSFFPHLSVQEAPGSQCPLAGSQKSHAWSCGLEYVYALGSQGAVVTGWFLGTLQNYGA